MIITPMIRNNICLNSHPAGCVKIVNEEIAYVSKTLAHGKSPADARAQAPEGSPRLALIVGCSTGYGLASRIAAAYGYGTATVGVSYEKAGTSTKPGTPGFYNNQAFDRAAAASALASETLDGDAFSQDMKTQAIAAIKRVAKAASLPAKIDLVVYSLASPVRVDPVDGTMYRSVIKPIGKPYSGLAMDVLSGQLSPVSVDPATEDEIAQTVKVMGGEDWSLWMDALKAADLLSHDVRTVAYSYLGPELSWGIYKEGTIGRAKEHLEKTARNWNSRLRSGGGGAWVSINKAVVTRSSAVIPIISLYISSLFKVMKEAGTHEGCIEQLIRLYRDRLYAPASLTNASRVPVDAEGRIRVDDWEMRPEIQERTQALMGRITEENLNELADVAGFRHDFMETHGFDVAGVDYDADIDPSGL